MKTFTIGELFDAIEKNGVEKIVGHFFATEQVDSAESYTDTPKTFTGKIVGACAFGQAFLNLGVTPIRYGSAWDWPEIDFDEQSLRNAISMEITNLNDSTDMPFKEIADHLRKEYADYLNIKITAQEYDYSEYLK